MLAGLVTVKISKNRNPINGTSEYVRGGDGDRAWPECEVSNDVKISIRANPDDKLSILESKD